MTPAQESPLNHRSELSLRCLTGSVFSTAPPNIFVMFCKRKEAAPRDGFYVRGKGYSWAKGSSFKIRDKTDPISSGNAAEYRQHGNETLFPRFQMAQWNAPDRPHRVLEGRKHKQTGI